jgi:hypothetical protein
MFLCATLAVVWAQVYAVPRGFIASGGAGSDQIDELCSSRTLLNGVQVVMDE